MTEQQEAAMRQALKALEQGLGHLAKDILRTAIEQQPAEEENQRLRALVRAQQITIEKLEQQPADVSLIDEGKTNEPVAYASDVEFDEQTEIIPAEQKGQLGTAGLRIPLYTRPQPAAWVGLEKKDMPDGEDPMYDHKYFIAGMVWANNKLLEKNGGKA